MQAGYAPTSRPINGQVPVSVESAIDALRGALGRQQVVTPDSPQEYTACVNKYWSAQQASTRPACFLQPQTTDEVSRAVSILRDTRMHFVIRAGGHTPYAGGSSTTSDGAVLDLALLDEVSVSEGEDGTPTTVRIGPGCRWLDVYKRLEPLGLAVVGGRVAGVGASGLILGGGISFLSNMYGFACDNVVSFELVTASGDVVVASEDSHADLFWALRGSGGRNFGVVTAIETKAYPHGKMWGGDRYYSISNSAELIERLVDYGSNGVASDPKGSMILGFAWTKEVGYFSSLSLSYADQLPSGMQAPSVFKDCLSIGPVLGDNWGNKWMSELTLELGGLSSSDNHEEKWRQSFWTFTTYLDLELTKSILSIFMSDTEALSGVEGVLPGIGLQIIAPRVSKIMSRAGGNCLGLEHETRPLLLVNPSVRWKFEADDELVMKTYARFVDRAVQEAKLRGLDHRFLYRNYASYSQILGAGNVLDPAKQKLEEIARKHDPDGIFIDKTLMKMGPK